MSRSPLDRLCERYHIGLDYHDIWGRRHPVSPQTRRALLTAMGVPTQTPAAMQQALAQAEAADWRRPLPPVQVVWADEQSIAIRLNVPADQAHQRFRWCLQREDGRDNESGENKECGEFSPAELEKLGQQSLDGETWQGHRLQLPVIPDPGYHRLELQNLAQPDRPPASLSLIVAPRRAYQPQAIHTPNGEGKGRDNDGRVWGPAIQLYAVRSARNWGIGDYTDLVHLLEYSARAGADLVGLNPLHVLFPHNPAHASPYSPSSRLFLNILYVDIEAVADFADCPAARQQVAEAAFQAQLRALRATDEVDYVAVAGVKMALLEMLYQHFRRHQGEAGGERAAAFEAFRHQQGAALHWHALYEALQETLVADDPDLWGWPAWPEAYRHPRSSAVERFAVEHEERVGFYEYCQWQAQQQLQAAGQRATELGMGVGLYQDLAVSVDVGGAEAWVQQDLYALTARIGSPPDDFNLQGQDWGLPPWRPEALREQAYAPFIATLRQNMRVAGALRIDHVMALMRLFWVTSGVPSGTQSESLPGPQSVAGAYVSYPFHDLLGILALESQRNRCLVIGEDLGTVPDALREALHVLGVLSYRLLYFEKAADGGFRPPRDFEPQALVAVTTHDLPTLAGYWQGADLELREQLGLFPSAELRERQVIARAEDRARLLMALEREGLLPAGMTVQTVDTPEMTQALSEAVHCYLARTPSKVLMVQLEDMLGQREQVNLPGTTDQYSNWCRRLSLALELWDDDPRLQSFVSVLREERGGAVTPPAAEMPGRPVAAVIPHSTYRLQFHREFGFDQGAEIVAYLHQLGISHCYASPCLQARPGSLHGYDIIDHDRLNPELGGDDAFERFSAALRERQMGLIMDMVPNHMGIMGRDNGWWLDVLENGPASNYAGFFDIDWAPLKDALRGKVLVPVLGDHYGSVLDRGELSLAFDAAGGAFCVRYYEHDFPIDPQEYPRILGEDMDRLEQRLGSEDGRLLALQSLITAFGNLPLRGESREALLAERARDKEVHKASLARLYGDADIARFVDENLRRFNQPDGVERLHGLLERQAWRLAYWRVASDEINYRRFFNINELAGLRVENTEVFEATHRRVLALIASDRVQGLRIDHPDGLYDPAGYFRRLQRRVALPLPVSPELEGSLPGAEQALSEEARPLYLLVEKIVAGHERLRQDWAVHGTTGYEFTNLVNGLFVDAGAEDSMERIYRDFVGESPAPGELVYDCKKLIMRSALASELNVLAQQLSRIGELERHTRDFTLNSLRDALSEIVAWFPVYRTYVTADGSTEEDRNYINWAVNVARKRSPAADTTVFDFVREVLLTSIAEGKRDDYRQRVTAFAMRFQQYTGPVMAKGLEDSAFYRYNRLLSLNEVGGEPERFGVSLAAFHHQNQERARFWPHAMLSSSTHDSKRSEDARARINVLSELPGEWQRRVRRWARLNRNKKRSIDNQRAPCRNDEYLLYQTLIGAWPLGPLDAAGLAGFRLRIQAYLIKAVKEAKQHTSWINPNADYEDAVTGFVEALLGELDNNPFLTDFLPFQQQVSRVGQFNSLSQTLLKLTAPGVPDIYQGNELWDFSLVDPDNRRPVDYGQRRALLGPLLEQTQASQTAGQPLTALCAQLLQQLDDGRAKLYLIWRSLQLRREHSALFLAADYLPLTASGTHAEHLCAFARRQGEQMAVIVIPRLIHRLAAGAAPLGEAVWGETWIELPAGLSAVSWAGWENGFTGETLQAEPAEVGWRLSAGRVLGHFPVALLIARLAQPGVRA